MTGSSISLKGFSSLRTIRVDHTLFIEPDFQSLFPDTDPIRVRRLVDVLLFTVQDLTLILSSLHKEVDEMLVDLPKRKAAKFPDLRQITIETEVKGKKNSKKTCASFSNPG